MPNNTLLATDAAEYLEELYQRVLPKRPAQLVGYLRANAWTPISDSQKVQLVAAATALVMLHGKDQTFVDQLLRTRVLTGTTVEPDRLILEALIDGLTDDAKSRNRLSAWSAAVRYLAAKNIKPSTIPALATVKGEGIDAWSRQAPGKATKRGRSAKAATKSPRACVVSFAVGGEIKLTLQVNDDRVLKKVIAQLKALAASFPVVESPAD